MCDGLHYRTTENIFGRGLARRATSDSSKIYIRISLQKLLFIENLKRSIIDENTINIAVIMSHYTTPKQFER